MQIRAGLAFQLKESAGWKYISSREESLRKLALARMESCANLVLLGNYKTFSPLFCSRFLTRIDRDKSEGKKFALSFPALCATNRRSKLFFVFFLKCMAICATNS